MYTLKMAFIVLSFLLLIGSCKKPDDDNSGYLVFGHFYGMCEGEQCVEIFKLETNSLLEDQKDQYPRSDNFYNGTYVQLDHTLFEQVRDLKDAFPQGLLDEGNHIIGQPDAGDWGGLYIEYSFNGIHKFWLIDQMGSNVPEYLHPFITKVNEKIAVINN